MVDDICYDVPWVRTMGWLLSSSRSYIAISRLWQVLRPPLAMENAERLPIDDKRRQDARDQKLLFREELVADRTRAAKRSCPCNVCLGEVRSVRYRATVRQHLRTYGRHPCRRGTTQVMLELCTTLFIAIVELNMYTFCRNLGLRMLMRIDLFRNALLGFTSRRIG